jgi:hypothetical protein
LRWRVKPGNWCLDGNAITDGTHSLSVHATVPLTSIELVNGWESRYYLKKSSLPVLEVEIKEPGILTTEYRWRL